MAMHKGGTKIQDPWRKLLFPVDQVQVFSDAAGVEGVSSSFKGIGVWEERSEKWLLSKWLGLVVDKFTKQLYFLMG